VVVDAAVNGTNKTTPKSGTETSVQKDLTGPTLLEMSGNPTYQELDKRQRKRMLRSVILKA
jgi:hypothetical protein